MSYFFKKINLLLILPSLGVFLFPVFSAYAESENTLPQLDFVKSISEQAHDLVAGYSEGFHLVGSSIKTGTFLVFGNYRKLPNIAAIELFGAEGLSGIYSEGFRAVGNDLAMGAFTTYSAIGRSVAQIGNTSDTKNSASLAAAAAPSPSLWCWLKGLVGLDCTTPTPPQDLAVIPPPPTKVQPSEKIASVITPPPTPPIAPAARPATDTSFFDREALRVVQNKVLSFNSILASLKNIFAPLSSVNSLDYRVAALENGGGATSATDPQARNGILALSKRVDALRSQGSSNFNSNYVYTPSAMLGADGQAVVFNSSGPNGTFTNGVTAQTGTFAGGVTGGSFTTAGGLSVTGASTLGSLAAGTSTLAGNFTAGNTLYVDQVNGRVGIGTSSPTDTLSVNGPIFFAPITPGATVSRLYNNGGDLYWAGNLIGGASTGNWATDGTHVWRATGNVGIGTTSPFAKLSVAGNGSFDADVRASYFTATSTTATSTFAGNLSVSGDTTLASSLTGFLKATAGRVATALINLTTDITGILAIGNGGTGTSTAPTYGKLLVGNNAGTYDLTATSSLGLINSLAGQYSPAQIGSTQTFATSSDTNIGLTIVSNGNVHTFTPTWTGTLDDSRITSASVWNAKQSALSFLYPLINTAGTVSTAFGTTTSNAFSQLQQFNANASTTQLTVTGNTYLATTGGNVGIGTTTPYSKLSVWGANTTTGVRNFELTNSASTSLAWADNAGNFNLPVATATTTIGGGLSVAGTAGLTVLQNGSVGIGTNSPKAKLDINGIIALNDNPLYLRAGNDASWNIDMGTPVNLDGQISILTSGNVANGGSGVLFGVNGGGSTMYVNTALGKVGIGTTTPYSKLSVWGANTTAGVRNFELTNSASTSLAWADNAGNFNLPVATATTTISGGLVAGGATGLTVLQNGNVGVGTTNPSTAFSVNGITTMVANNGSAINLTNSGVVVGNIGLNTANEITLNSLDVTGNFIRFTTGAFGGQSSFPAIKRNGAGLIFRIADDSGDATTTMAALTVSSTTVASTFAGNVGIGTTSPYSKLSVWGANTTAGTRNFELTNSASTTLFSMDNAGTGYFFGNLGIGTTSPYAKLSVVGEAVANFFTANATTATSTFAGDVNIGSGALTYTNSTGVTNIANLNLGAQSFESDAGILSWADMPVTTTSVSGTVNSYSAQIDSNPIITVYSESLGDGTVWNNSVGIGTTTPQALFSLAGISTTTTVASRALFDIANSSGASFLRVSASGNLGMGTATPAWLTQLVSPTSPQFALTDPNAGINLKHWTMRSLAGSLYFATSSDAYATSSLSALTVDANGNMGIGTTSPWRKLSVNGTVAMNALGTSQGNAVCITAGGEITNPGAAVCTGSSARFKENIETLSTGFALDELKKLTVVSFDYKNGAYSPEDLKGSYGMIAEDVEKIDPKLVDYGYDGLPLTLKFEKFIGLLVQGVQELVARVTGLEEKMNTQQQEIDALKARMNMLDLPTAGTQTGGQTSPPPVTPIPTPAPEPTPIPDVPAPDQPPTGDSTEPQPAPEPLPTL